MVPWNARFGGFVWDLCLALTYGMICVPAGHGVIPLGFFLLGIPEDSFGFLFWASVALMAMLIVIEIRWLYVAIAAIAITAMVSTSGLLIFRIGDHYHHLYVTFVPFLGCLIWRSIMLIRIAFVRE